MNWKVGQGDAYRRQKKGWLSNKSNTGNEDRLDS